MAPPSKKTAAGKKAPAKKKAPTAAQKAKAKAERQQAQIEALTAQVTQLTTALSQSVSPAVSAAPAPVTPAEPVEAPAEAPDASQGTGPLTIRNKTATPFRMDLKGNLEKPYRVALSPRGQHGDTAEIPEACTQDTTFVNTYYAGIYEIIPRSEARDIQYAPSGYQARPVAPLVRPEDTTIAHVQMQHNAKGMVTQQQNMMPVQPSAANVEMTQQTEQLHATHPTVVGMPGSDPQLTAQFQSHQQAAPLAQQHTHVSPAEAAAMQKETGRTEVTPDKLIDKGVMPPLPERVSFGQGNGGQVQWP